MRVLVTDADTPLAQALLPALCAHPGVTGVTGIAALPPIFEHASFRALHLDYRDAAAHSVLRGHDALVHLARHAAPDATSETPDAAVRPVHRFFHAAHDAGLKRLVHLSTAAVYGTAVHVSEQAPMKPLPGFRYAQEQACLEQLLAIDFPDCVRLRPHLIVGPHADPAVRRLLRLPFYARHDEPLPLFQCVHEDDLVSAVLLSLRPGPSGAYNLATEDGVSVRDAIRARHRFAIGLSLPAARRGIAITNGVFKTHIDPAWLERSSHTLLVNCRRALIELGWTRRYGALAAIRAS